MQLDKPHVSKGPDQVDPAVFLPYHTGRLPERGSHGGSDLSSAGFASHDVLLARLKEGQDAPKSAAPKYDPAKWNKNDLTANCYVYALNDYNPKYMMEATNMTPGNGKFSTVDIKSTNPKDFDRFTKETIAGAEADGLKYTGRDPRAAPGHYKVALFTKPSPGGPDDDASMDFHWMRQDSNGHWSQKFGASPVTDRDLAGKPITDPAHAKEGAYKFVGYFDVPAGGINLHRKEYDFTRPAFFGSGDPTKPLRFPPQTP